MPLPPLVTSTMPLFSHRDDPREDWTCLAGAGDLEVTGTERLKAPVDEHCAAQRSAHRNVGRSTRLADNTGDRVLIIGTGEHRRGTAAARAAGLADRAADDACRVLPHDVVGHGFRGAVCPRDDLG